jgi:hypothetical protein
MIVSTDENGAYCSICLKISGGILLTACLGNNQRDSCAPFISYLYRTLLHVMSFLVEWSQARFIFHQMYTCRYKVFQSPHDDSAASNCSVILALKCTIIINTLS